MRGNILKIQAILIEKMMTYEEIYNLLRKEKYSEQLQDMPRNFLNEVANYLKEKRGIVVKESDMFSEVIVKTKKQLDNSVAVIKELMLRRKKKILNLAFVAAETGVSKKDFENLLPHENALFETVVEHLEEVDKTISKALNGIQDDVPQNKIVKFNVDVSPFLDEEGNTLGPYKKGDIVSLPENICKILTGDNKAEIIYEGER